MTILGSLIDWTLRSSILIAGGGLLFWTFRIKHPCVRLTAWTAILAASLSIPVLTHALPKTALVVSRIEPVAVEPFATPPGQAKPQPIHGASSSPARLEWRDAALAIWGAGAAALLLRLLVGLALSLRLLRRSRPVDRKTEGIQIRESDRIGAPVALGIVRPVILLPADWREWNTAQLDAVLAHERSHIVRRDAAVQLLSAIHRALLWITPLSWFLHQRIVRTAEEASDDAAIAATGDRAFYAQTVLDFMQRGIGGVRPLGVPMARYDRPEKRINRILYGVFVSRGLTRWSFAGILAVALPLAYFVASANPSQAALPLPIPAQVQQLPVQKPAPQPPTPKPAVAVRRPQPAREYLSGLGTVTATTISVTAKVDGELKSVAFDEGKPVEAGQLLASIDPHDAQAQLQQALAALARDKQRLGNSAGLPSETVVDIENHVNVDQQQVQDLTREVAYGQIHAPFAGVAGFRKVDPGNSVHAGEVLVVITQVQPIAVVFTLPEDDVPVVQARLRQGTPVTAEAWNRDMTTRLASGRLTAMDNLIDESSGMVKLKSIFDNKDGALFPNQFVNVRLLMNTR